MVKVVLTEARAMLPEVLQLVCRSLARHSQAAKESKAMAKSKKSNKQESSNVVFTLETTVSTLPAVQSKWQSLLPYLGKARRSSKPKDGERKFGEVIQLRDLLGNLSLVYDCAYGNKGAERAEDWKPTKEQRERAKELTKAFDRDYRAVTARETVLKIDGVNAHVLRFQPERVVRDRKTGDMVRIEGGLRYGKEIDVKMQAQDKLERHRKAGEAIKAWAAAQGVKL